MADIYINDPDLATPEHQQAMEEMHYWRTVTDMADLVRSRGLVSVMTDLQAELDKSFTIN